MEPQILALGASQMGVPFKTPQLQLFAVLCCTAVLDSAFAELPVLEE